MFYEIIQLNRKEEYLISMALMTLKSCGNETNKESEEPITELEDKKTASSEDDCKMLLKIKKKMNLMDLSKTRRSM